ncbi:MAG TPA: hypothetical protein VF595_08120 [Tepidisphaeraceae bacterium]|jgi:hypothetical protein
MDIVKKNLVSIICGVIALLCVVLIFYPLGGMYTDIATQLRKSTEIGSGLEKVANEQRTWPTLSSKDEDRQPLRRFPTEPVYEAGRKITEGWAKTTSDFVDAAVRIQQEALQPLVPNALPGGTGQQSIAYRFMDAYRKVMGAMMAAPASGGGAGAGTANGGLAAGPGNAATSGPPAPVLNSPLVGRLPPTEPEIKARGDVEEANIKRDLPIIINGQVSNLAQVNAAIVRQRGVVGDQLRAEVAKLSMVYLDPATTFVAHDKIVGNTAPAANDIFIAQVGLWLQQEICRAIYDINRPAVEKFKQGVIEAPIKRLISIRFALPYSPPPAVAAAVAPVPAPAAPAGPVVPPLPTAKVPVDFARNPLGQTTNDLYDVLPFNMTIVCEAASLPDVLAGLGRNRYLSVRSVDVQTVDSAVAHMQGFIYGSRPVVQVHLRAQYLLLRRFIGPLMPPDMLRGGVGAPGGVPGAAPVDTGSGFGIT